MQIQKSIKGRYIISKQLSKIQGAKVQQKLRRSIGAIVCFNRQNETVYGSAFLISKNLVVTSARNIYNRDLNEQNTNFKFYLGVDEVAKDYYEIQSLRYMPEYKTCQNKDKLAYDFALLKLKKDVEFSITNNWLRKIVGWFSTPSYPYLQLSLPCQLCLLKNNQESVLSILGYPRYGNNYEHIDQQGSQFILNPYGLTGSNRIININSQQSTIWYEMNTLVGQSGCPVVVNQQIIGIHVGPHGRLIDIDFFNKIQDWRKQLNGNPFQVCSSNLCSHVQPRLKHYLECKQLKSITNLHLTNKGLKQININLYMNLTQLYLQNNQLSAIDVTNNINLTSLFLSNNHIQYIDVSNNTKLIELFLSHNQLKTIDTTKNGNLTCLSLRQNQLAQIRCILSDKLQIRDYIFRAFDFSHQRSDICQIKIVCGSSFSDKNKFDQLKEGWGKKHSQDGNKSYNKYGCSYIFTAINT